jgi:hypothetical protein
MGASFKFDREKVVNAMRQAAAKAINAGAKEMQQKIKYDGLNRVSGWKSKAGAWPGKNSGKLAGSIKLVPATKTNLNAKVGSNIAQARYMQYGVKPVKKGGLTVPVNKEAATKLASYGGIRNYARAEGLVFIRSKHKQNVKGVWVKLRGSVKRKNQRMEVMVALRKSVAARPWATLGLKEFRDVSVKAARDTFAREWGIVTAKIQAKYGGSKP